MAEGQIDVKTLLLRLNMEGGAAVFPDLEKLNRLLDEVARRQEAGVGPTTRQKLAIHDLSIELDRAAAAEAAFQKSQTAFQYRSQLVGEMLGPGASQGGQTEAARIASDEAREYQRIEQENDAQLLSLRRQFLGQLRGVMAEEEEWERASLERQAAAWKAYQERKARDAALASSQGAFGVGPAGAFGPSAAGPAGGVPPTGVTGGMSAAYLEARANMQQAMDASKAFQAAQAALPPTLNAVTQSTHEQYMAIQQARAALNEAVIVHGKHSQEVKNSKAALDALNPTLANNTSQVERFGRGILGSITGLSVFAGTAVLAGRALGDFVTSSTERANQLIQAIAGIAAVNPAINDEELFHQLSEMQSKTGETSEKMAKDMAVVEQAFNLPEAAALHLTQTLAASGQANRQDTEAWTSAVIRSMEAYGAAVDQAAHYEDVLTQVLRNSAGSRQVEVERFAEISQAAELSGTNMEQMAAAVTVLGEHGGNTTRNLQGLKQLFDDLGTRSTQEGLAKIGVVTEDDSGKALTLTEVLGQLEEKLRGLNDRAKDAALAQVFPGRNSREVVETLIKSLLDLNVTEKQYVDNTNSADAATKRWLNSTAGRLKQSEGEFKHWQEEVGKAINPVNWIAGIITWQKNTTAEEDAKYRQWLASLDPTASDKDLRSKYGVTKEQVLTAQKEIGDESSKWALLMRADYDDVIAGVEGYASSSTAALHQAEIEQGQHFLQMQKDAEETANVIKGLEQQMKQTGQLSTVQAGILSHAQTEHAETYGPRPDTTDLMTKYLQGLDDAAKKAQTAAEATDRFNHFLSDTAGKDKARTATDNLKKTTDDWNNTIDAEKEKLRELKREYDPELTQAQDAVDAAQKKLDDDTLRWKDTIGAVSTEITRLKAEEATYLAPAEAAYEKAQGTLRRFDREQQAMALESKNKLYDLHLQIQQIDDDYKDLLSRLTADAQRAADALQAIVDETALVDEGFRSAMHDLDDQEYNLRKREEATMRPLNAEVDKYNAQLEAERRAAQAVADEYDQRLIPAQRELAALKAEDIKAEHAKTLRNEGLAIANLRAQIDQLAPGSERRVQLEAQLAEAQAKRQRDEKEFGLEEKIDALQREKQARLEQLAAEQKATELMVQGAKDRQKAAQDEFNAEHQAISDHREDLAHEQSDYDYLQHQKELAAQADVKRANKSLADEQKYVKDLKQPIQDQIDYQTALQQSYDHTAENNRVGLNAQVEDTKNHVEAINDYYHGPNGLITNQETLKTSLEQTRDAVVEADATAVRSAQNTYTELKKQYDKKKKLIDDNIAKYEEEAKSAEASARRQVDATQKEIDKLAEEYALIVALNALYKAGGEPPAGYKLPPGYVPPGPPKTDATGPPGIPSTVPNTPTNRRTGEGYSGSIYGTRSVGDIYASGRNQGPVVGNLVVQLSISPQMVLGRGDPNSPEYWYPVADPIAQAIFQRLGAVL